MSSLGNINSCLSPKRVYNRYIDETFYVPCRKCFRCRDTYASSWSRRIEVECKQHRYSLFVTLTYDNEHLPVFSPLFMDDGVASVWSSNRSCDSGKFLDSDLCEPLHPQKYPESMCFAYPCKKDVQDFLKRLRSTIDYKLNRFKHSDEFRIRYFICAEYGPGSFRPHYHAILWYDSEELQRFIVRFISETWQNGNTVCSLVNGSAPRYVAKYVNGDTSLPPFLRTEFTRTFHLASKHPYIGYCEADEVALRTNVLDGTFGQSVLDPDTGSFEFVPTPRSLENRLLPKCRGYRSMSHFERVRVYSLAYDYEQKGIDFRGLLPFEFDYSSYPSLDIHSTLVCLDWCHRYHMTPEIFVSLLEDYYYRKDMYLLRMQYEYQQTYVNQLGLPVWHLVDFDLRFFEYLPRSRSEFLRSPWKSVFSTYGLDSSVLYHTDGYLNVDVIKYFRQYYSRFYADNVARYSKIHDDSLKNKKLNERLDPNLFT